MFPLTKRSVVFLMRRDKPDLVPEWLLDEEATVRLRDGTLVVPGRALFKKGDVEHALSALVELFYFAVDEYFGDPGTPAFHQDPRGIRCIAYRSIGDLRSVPFVDEVLGRDCGLDIDYEGAVQQTGVWISVPDAVTALEARNAEIDRTETRGAKSSGGFQIRPEQATTDRAPKERAADLTALGASEHEVACERNIVVVGYPLERLPTEVRLLGSLPDGTMLVTGPKQKAWVDALRAAAPADSLRLIRGPEDVGRVLRFPTFEMLVEGFREAGAPTLVMRPPD